MLRSALSFRTARCVFNTTLTAMRKLVTLIWTISRHLVRETSTQHYGRLSQLNIRLSACVRLLYAFSSLANGSCFTCQEVCISYCCSCAISARMVEVRVSPSISYMSSRTTFPKEGLTDSLDMSSNRTITDISHTRPFRPCSLHDSTRIPDDRSNR